MSDLLMPRVRLEVESMKHSIVSMLMDRHEDLVKVVDAAVDAAMVEMPITLARQTVRMSEEICESALRQALEDYWTAGKGREALDKAIHAKFKDKMK